MQDFEPKAVFRRIDRLNKKAISIDDLKLFLKGLSVSYTEQQLIELLKFYSKKKMLLTYYE